MHTLTAKSIAARQERKTAPEREAAQGTGTESSADLQVRRLRAKAAAYANIAKHGRNAAATNLRRGVMARFERQVEEQNPGLKERDPRDFAERVEAAEKAHIFSIAAKSASSRAAKKCQRTHEREPAQLPLPPDAGDYSI